jgi:hypothetical protein
MYFARQRLVKTSPLQQIHKLQSSNFRSYAKFLQTRLRNNIEAVFSARSVQRGYKEEFSWVQSSRVETPACRNVSMGAEELNWVENNDKKGIGLCSEV